MPSSGSITGKAPQCELCGRPRLAMTLLTLAQQPAEAVDRRIDAGEPQQAPKHGLGRGDDRLADSRLERVDDRMRAEIEAGGNQPVRLRVPNAKRQVEDRIGFRLGKAKALGDTEMRAGDGFDPAFGEKALLGRVDGLDIGRNSGHPPQAKRAASGENAVGRGRRRNPGDMRDLAAQPLIEGMTLDDARRGAPIGDRVRPAASDLLDRPHAVLAVHRDDLFRRAATGDQHPGEMDADTIGDDARVPLFNDDIDARQDDPKPCRPGHGSPPAVHRNAYEQDSGATALVPHQAAVPLAPGLPSVATYGCGDYYSLLHLQQICSRTSPS